MGMDLHNFEDSRSDILLVAVVDKDAARGSFEHTVNTMIEHADHDANRMQN